MTSSQSEKATRFRGLHQDPGFFVIANAWDAGSARILAGLGFEALATTSLGLANIHGRGLTLRPIIGDVESFTLMQADGELVTCSRRENSELFGLVIGGYGLFGVVTSVRVRLVPRKKVERVVELRTTDVLIAAFESVPLSHVVAYFPVTNRSDLPCGFLVTRMCAVAEGGSVT